MTQAIIEATGHNPAPIETESLLEGRLLDAFLGITKYMPPKGESWMIASALLRRAIGGLTIHRDFAIALIPYVEDRAEIQPFEDYLRFAYQPTYRDSDELRMTKEIWESANGMKAPERVIVISDQIGREEGPDILAYKITKMILIYRAGHLYDKDEYDAIYSAYAALNEDVGKSVMKYLAKQRKPNEKGLTYDPPPGASRVMDRIIPKDFPTDAEIILGRLNAAKDGKSWQKAFELMNE